MAFIFYFLFFFLLFNCFILWVYFCLSLFFFFFLSYILSLGGVCRVSDYIIDTRFCGRETVYKNTSFLCVYVGQTIAAK